jgi:hypothetical protein
MNTLNECKVHLYQGSKIISELVGVDFNLKTRFMGDPNKRFNPCGAPTRTR